MLNKVMLVGNLAANAEIRRTQSGTVLAKFRLIENDSKRDRLTNEMIPFPRGHNIVVYGKLAKYCEKAALKGNLFLVEGKLTYNTFTGNNGDDVSITEIVISDSYGEVRSLSKRNETDRTDH